MKKFLLGLLATVMASTALAAGTSATLTWTPPTANSDGSTPPLIGGYNIYVASTDAALTALPNTIAGGKANSVGNVLTYTYTNLAPGTYYFAVTTWACPTAATCVESVQSAHVSYTVPTPTPVVVKPNPPATVTVK